VDERLQKILSRAGVASRRGSEDVMTQGRVTVNGEVVKELGTKADVTKDDIRVDGVRIKPPQEPVYLVLNKPKGVITTRHDPEGRPTVMHMVPPVQGLFPVGRLDISTEGLIVLTNDGAFAERVSHPRYEVPRIYHAKVFRVPDAKALERLRAGVVVDGQRMRVDDVRVLEAENNSWIELRLHEGRNHEVRRLMEAVGHPVSKLRRVAFGPLTTRGLEPGQYRHLTPGEIAGLLGRGRKGPARPIVPARRPPPRGRSSERPQRSETTKPTRPFAPKPTRPAPRDERSTRPAPRDERSRGDARPARNDRSHGDAKPARPGPEAAAARPPQKPRPSRPGGPPRQPARGSGRDRARRPPRAR
jgi:23S rRNA pseudouridine2605 synthase